MDHSIKSIPHLKEIKEIRRFEKVVLNETNIPVFDISHWNSGSEYKNLILSKYKLFNPLNFLDYHYSYEYDNFAKQQVIKQVKGTFTNKHNCVFISNSTAAICCIADYLKKFGYKKIFVMEPAYFSIYSCLLSFGLNVYKDTVILKNNEIELPYDNIIKNSYDVLWITSPIFSTGIYFTQTQINFFNSLLEKGVLLIIDESAASPNTLLTKYLYPSKNIITIFSPHKYLSINSIKFAAIICPNFVSNYIEDWIDVFAGSLPTSTCMAIEHYLSSNFISCINIHDGYINSNINAIQKLCSQFPDNYFIGTSANYITICNKSLPYINTIKQLDMLQIMKHTHVSFIPGYINGFNEKWGFCYRVNLTHDTNIIKNSLGRLFKYFL